MSFEELRLIFLSEGIPVRGAKGGMVGLGLIERDLIKMGFEKTELRKLVKNGLLEKVTTRIQNSWRNTYVLPTSTEEH